VQRWAEVARRLQDCGRVLVTGSAGEREVAEQVIAAAGLPPEACVAGDTDLCGLASLVGHARLLVPTPVWHIWPPRCVRRPSCCSARRHRGCGGRHPTGRRTPPRRTPPGTTRISRLLDAGPDRVRIETRVEGDSGAVVLDRVHLLVGDTIVAVGITWDGTGPGPAGPAALAALAALASCADGAGSTRPAAGRSDPASEERFWEWGRRAAATGVHRHTFDRQRRGAGRLVEIGSWARGVTDAAVPSTGKGICPPPKK